MLYPLGAAVTFLQPAVPAKTRRPKGTGHGAAVAADTDAWVIYRESGFPIFAQTARGTSLDAGRILTMHAGHGKIHETGLFFSGFLQVGNDAQRLVPCLQLNIILIHAGHRTGAAANTFISVEIQDIFHAYSPILSTLHAL